MGYLSTGFAFGTTPNWEALERLLHSFSLRGYRHKTSQLSLLDAWQPGKGTPNRFPFSTGPIKAESITGVLPTSATTLAFDAVRDVLSDAEAVEYGANWLSLPLMISSAAGSATFAFTADDEAFDFAALAEAGSIVRMGCRIGLFDIFLQQATLHVVPYISEEDECEELDDELISVLQDLENVHVMPPRTLSGGFRIYQHPSDLWPVDWGDAEHLLGFGTFDPFKTFTDEFELVHEHEPRVSASSHRQSRKLW